MSDTEIQAAMVRVGEDARRRAFAAGCPVVYVENGWIIEEWADGRKVPVEPLRKP
jgi:hypothetical protein